MWDAGFVYALRSSGPRTSESASSSWATAQTTDGRAAARHTTQTGVMHPGTTLTDAIRMWPTPTEDNANNAGGPSRREGMDNSGYQDLTVAATLWATPQTHDTAGARTPEQIHRHRQRTGAGAKNLHEQAPLWEQAQDLAASPGAGSTSDPLLWQTPQTDSFRCSRGGDRAQEPGLDHQARLFPTPASRDHRTPNSSSYQERKNNTKGEQLQNFIEHQWSLFPPASPQPQAPPTLAGQPSSATSPGSPQPSPNRLNPTFVEFLLALPPFWTLP